MNHEDKLQSTYERVTKLKSELGIPYTKMAAAAGLTRGQMEKLTQKACRMTDENLNKLVTYLESMGF